MPKAPKRRQETPGYDPKFTGNGEHKIQKSLRVLSWRFGGAQYITLHDVFVPDVNPALDKYERDVISGKIECPFKVEHKNKDGKIVAQMPLKVSTARKLYFK